MELYLHSSIHLYGVVLTYEQGYLYVYLCLTMHHAVKAYGGMEV